MGRKRKYSSYQGEVGKKADDLIQRQFEASKLMEKCYTCLLYTSRYDGYKILTYSSGKKGVRYLFTATDSQAADNPYQYVQFSDHQICLLYTSVPNHP